MVTIREWHKSHHPGRGADKPAVQIRVDVQRVTMRACHAGSVTPQKLSGLLCTIIKENVENFPMNSTGHTGFESRIPQRLLFLSHSWFHPFLFWTKSIYMKYLCLFLFILPLGYLSANNIQVNNVSLTGQNTVEGYTLVQFDLSWDNSWRISSGPANYDGAWVFIKYRQNNGAWQHATINYVNGTAAGDGHTAPAGSVIQTSSDGVGAFVYREADGSGDVQFIQMQLRWNYGVDNVADAAIVDVQVYAIEMVYIPEGAYPLGSNFSGTEANHFYTLASPQFPVQFPYSVQSENAIPVSSTPGDLYYTNTPGNGGDQLGPIPAAYPKGFAAFWIMKYEITEDQWICFFNSLTENQKLAHDITDASHKNSDAVILRNTISYTSGNATTSAPARASPRCLQIPRGVRVPGW